MSEAWKKTLKHPIVWIAFLAFAAYFALNIYIVFFEERGNPRCTQWREFQTEILTGSVAIPAVQRECVSWVEGTRHPAAGK